jgi:integrase/recombinase XerD
MRKRTRPKAPAGCYWRGTVLWGRAKIRGETRRWSLETDNTKIAAERRKKGRDRLIADEHGDAIRTFAEVMEDWVGSVTAECGPKTVQRYLCSIEQWSPWLDGRTFADVMKKRFLAHVIRERRKKGITNATIKRDLVAMSSIANFAVIQDWLEANPVLPLLKATKEKRHPIVLPQADHVELVIGRCPGMIADMVRSAVRTGAREQELYTAHRTQVDHDKRQMTLIGKGRSGAPKTRVIDLEPFGGYDTIRPLPAYVGSPWLFWHGNGEPYRNFASQFADIVRRTAKWAAANGVDFRPFRFHDTRHLHAVNWLKDGRSIYVLQKRLGHSSIKVTELYLDFLTPEEQLAAKGLAAGGGGGVAQKLAQSAGDVG